MENNVEKKQVFPQFPQGWPVMKKTCGKVAFSSTGFKDDFNVISTCFPPVFHRKMWKTQEVRLSSIAVIAVFTESSTSRRDFILSTECIMVV